MESWAWKVHFHCLCCFSKSFRGCCNFLDLTMLYWPKIATNQKGQNVELTFFTVLKGFLIKSDHFLAGFREQVIIKVKKIYSASGWKFFFGFLSGRALVMFFEKTYGAKFWSIGGAVNFWRVVGVDPHGPPPLARLDIISCSNLCTILQNLHHVSFHLFIWWHNFVAKRS